MPKGIAQRRRLKRALEAARGNLHKIANGKALPTDLPEAPKPKDAEKLPASLRKMLALKAAAAQHERAGGKGVENSAPSKAPASTKSKKAPGLTKASDGADDEPSISGRAEEGREKQRQEEGCDGNVNGGSAPAAFAVKGANPFTEQFVQKKLKDRKKEYLKRKAEKKRRKGTGGQVVVEKELQLKDHVKFGEVVHAPLQVHLKRKHWAEKEKTANERCKEVFLKQMQQAQQQIAAGAAARTDDGIAMRKGGGGKGGKAAKGADGDSAQQNRKRKAPMDAETEELRQQVIESYRAAKKGTGFHNSTVGQATLASLSHLVGKSAGAKAASTAGGGKKTHTLA